MTKTGDKIMLTDSSDLSLLQWSTLNEIWRYINGIKITKYRPFDELVTSITTAMTYDKSTKELKKMTVTELKSECHSIGLSKTGKKEELLQKLVRLILIVNFLMVCRCQGVKEEWVYGRSD